MKVLITGGCGFVGGHLVDALVDKHEVMVIDDYSNGDYENPKATYFKGDVAGSVGLTHSLSILKPDLVYHLACYPRSMSLLNPHRDMQVNYGSMVTLCEAARHGGFGIVFSSNSGLLGPPVYLPYDERHPAHPLTPYDNHKYAAENLLRLYAENYGVRSYVFRFASVYGPRQKPNPELGWMPLIPTWIQALLKNEPVTVEGDGTQTRDFIYVDDVVKALVKAGEVLGWSHGMTGPYLLASGKETQIKDLLEWLKVLIPSKSPIVDAPEKLGDIRRMAYDTHAVRLALQWEATTTLEQGLQKTVDYWKNVCQ